jgi:hypothetical protein
MLLTYINEKSTFKAIKSTALYKRAINITDFNAYIPNLISTLKPYKRSKWTSGMPSTNHTKLLSG